MYKTGSVGYLEVLFGAEDFTDLLSRIDMLQKILVHDQNLIQSLKEQRDIIEQKKVELETIKDDLLALFKSKIAKQNELNVRSTILWPTKKS
jgi:peptidoglycan hydrolase CwlO-like protein